MPTCDICKKAEENAIRLKKTEDRYIPMGPKYEGEDMIHLCWECFKAMHPAT